ncbi:hypothetical protein ACIA8K_34780 [Catenuloplanes sp. NPDC051500]|uniref:hypothetical protein n=1 Tax=Catenuloplanes sp. NPDC051500 TaxID=3363959 RepID=UPI0037A30125
MNVPTVAELTRSARAADADDVAAALEAGGLTDHGALRGYGAPTVFALGESLLGHLRRRRWIRAGVRSGRVPYLRASLRRAALYAIPVLLAAVAPLDRAGWVIVAGVLLLGWPAVQALTSVGRLYGPARGLRVAVAGFALLGMAAAGLVGAALWWTEGGLGGAAWGVAGSAGVASEVTGSGGAPSEVTGSGGTATEATGSDGVASGAAGSDGTATEATGSDGTAAEVTGSGVEGWGSAVRAGMQGVAGAEPRAVAWSAAAGLAVFAALVAAVVTGRERAMLRAFLPACAVAIVMADDGGPARLPTAPALLVCVFGAALWMLRPVSWTWRSAPWPSRRPPPPSRRPPWPTHERAGLAGSEGTDGRPTAGPGVWRTAAGHALIGFGQITTFVLACLLVPGSSPMPPVAVPMLIALPLLEVFAGWRAAQTAGALDAYDTVRAYRRHIGGVTLVSIIGLTPPLLVGIATTLAIHLVPHPLAEHATARATALSLTAGLLLAGLHGVILLLAAQGRITTAALVSLVPAPLAAAALCFGAALVDRPAIDLALSVLAGAAAVSYGAGLLSAAIGPGATR